MRDPLAHVVLGAYDVVRTDLGEDPRVRLADRLGPHLADAEVHRDRRRQDARLEVRADADDGPLELVHAEGGAFSADAGYEGTIVRVPSVAEAVAAVAAGGGSVLRDAETVEYAAALVPDEDDETLLVCRQRLIGWSVEYDLVCEELAQLVTS